MLMPKFPSAACFLVRHPLLGRTLHIFHLAHPGFPMYSVSLLHFSGLGSRYASASWPSLNFGGPSLTDQHVCRWPASVVLHAGNLTFSASLALDMGQHELVEHGS